MFTRYLNICILAAALLFASCINDEEYNGVVDTSMTVLPNTRFPFSKETPVYSATLVDFVGEEGMQIFEQYNIHLSTGLDLSTDIPLLNMTAGLPALGDSGISLKQVILEGRSVNTLPFTLYVTPYIPGGGGSADIKIKQGDLNQPSESKFSIVIENNKGINLDEIVLQVYAEIEGETIKKYTPERKSSITFYIEYITLVSGVDLNFN